MSSVGVASEVTDADSGHQHSVKKSADNAEGGHVVIKLALVAEIKRPKTQMSLRAG